jgi:aminoglycoside phosphotransferase (APT) family kinase protein
MSRPGRVLLTGNNGARGAPRHKCPACRVAPPRGVDRAGILPPVTAAAPRRRAGDVLARLLAEQAPGLAGLPVTELPGGQDNAVFRVGSELVARLPRHEPAAQLMAHELHWAAEAAAGLPCATSVPVLEGRPSADYPWPWSLARWIEGRTADVGVPDADAAGLADDLVALLAALHRPAAPQAPRNPVRDVPLRDREQLHAQVLAELDHPDAALLTRELHALAAVPGPRGLRRWVHGDLHPRNLVLRDGRLAGVLDWGDLHGGDPAVDLAGVWMVLPEPLHDRVRSGLAVDQHTWQRARGWALVLGVMFLRIAHQQGDAAFAEMGRTTLARACPDGAAT